MNPLEWLEFEVLGNTVLRWALGAAVLVAVWMALLLVRRVLRVRLEALGRSSEVLAIEIAARVVSATKGWFLLLLALLVGSRFWMLAAGVDAAVTSIATIALIVQGGLWAGVAWLHFLDTKRKRELEDNPGGVAAMDVLSFVVRLALWSVVLLLVLDNLGVNVTTLIAGLGVGGIAVALAAQNILGDLFASLSIVLDKPFVVGDFVVVGDCFGTIEKVGIKTTRVRSLSGEQLIFSNNDLLSSRIRNYGRMAERRVLFSIGVTYGTPLVKLEAIPGILREAVEGQSDVRFDRAHFQQYGDFALLFEVVYYVLSRDYNKYMDTQQAINLFIYERFQAQGIEFAYPTQTLYVKRVE